MRRGCWWSLAGATEPFAKSQHLGGLATASTTVPAWLAAFCAVCCWWSRQLLHPCRWPIHSLPLPSCPQYLINVGWTSVWVKVASQWVTGEWLVAPGRWIH